MLHYNTINDALKSSLDILMTSPLFDSFRLVGGTALSLQKGHRISIDIDLFSDAPNKQTMNIMYMMMIFIYK